LTLRPQKKNCATPLAITLNSLFLLGEERQRERKGEGRGGESRAGNRREGKFASPFQILGSATGY